MRSHGYFSFLESQIEDLKNCPDGFYEEELFSKIKEYCFYYLTSNGYLDNYDIKIIDELSFDLAHLIFDKEFTEEPVYSYYSYLSKITNTVLVNYLREFSCGEIINTHNDLNFIKSIIKSCASINSYNDYLLIENYDRYMSLVPYVINKVLDRCKYKKYSPEYQNLKLSVLLSLKNRCFIMIGNSYDYNYYNLVYNNIRFSIIKEIYYNSDSPLQLNNYFTEDWFDE